jgi:hypothetical protein
MPFIIVCCMLEYHMLTIILTIDLLCFIIYTVHKTRLFIIHLSISLLFVLTAILADEMGLGKTVQVSNHGSSLT